MTAMTDNDYMKNRFEGIERAYTEADVTRLRGSVKIEYTLADLGAKRLWRLMQERPYVNALGALTGNQAVQQVKAGLEAIYLSGWQVAADANLAGQMYPDQSLYPANSVPHVVKRIKDLTTPKISEESTVWTFPVLGSGFRSSRILPLLTTISWSLAPEKLP